MRAGSASPTRFSSFTLERTQERQTIEQVNAWLLDTIR